MQINNPPSKLVLPFGANDPTGRATIPVTTSSPGYASLSVGFPPITRTPKAAGGIPPRGLDFNGILYSISAAARWSAAGGGYKYDAAFANDTNVGGYPQGAVVLNAAGTSTWRNLVDGNTTNPDTGGANWRDETPYGVNQTWQDVTGSRSSGVTYTNNTGRTITAAVTILSSGAPPFDVINITVGGVALYDGDTGVGDQRSLLTFVIPPGQTYSVSVTSTSPITRWVELR